MLEFVFVFNFVLASLFVFPLVLMSAFVFRVGVGVCVSCYADIGVDFFFMSWCW